MKKFVICFIIILLCVLGISFYKYETQSVECWWGVLYPSLSYIAFEDDDDNIKLSTLDTDYIYIPDTTVKTKLLIAEWFKQVFNFGHN